MKRFCGLAGALVSLLCAVQPAQAAAGQGLKLYISVDMEGICGVVTGEQLGPEGFEYARFREFMTDEVNAVIQAASDAGATEFLVSDSHGNGQNLLIERLPEQVTVVRSWPRPLMMMEGIDKSFDGAILLGYHAGAHSLQGVRAHTISSALLTEVRINGAPVSEGALSAAIAGHFGVPVILVTGDDKVVEETTKTLGQVEGAVVKWAYGFHSARTLTPKRCNEVIGAATRRALARIEDFKPYRQATPIRLDVSFKNYRPVELLSYLPIVQRLDAHTIRFLGKDVAEVSRFLEFVTSYEPGLAP